MSTANCTDYGGTDNTKFGEPLPWIGLYVALASLGCLLLMSADLFRILKWKETWITSKIFVFNASTLTLLAIATKLPSDIITTMPGPIDQLTKLTGLLLLCVSMILAMPSLQTMDGHATSNITALGIMVATLLVDIQLQLTTGLISNSYLSFYYQVYSIYMFLLFVVLLYHSFNVSASRMILYKRYGALHEKILLESDSVDDVNTRFSNDKLEEYVSKYWLMAVTSSPEYAIRSSEVSYLLPLVSLLPLIYSITITIILTVNSVLGHNTWSCYSRSEYKWSIWTILPVQVLAILVGIVLVIRRGLNSHSMSVHLKDDLCQLIGKYSSYKLLLDVKDITLPVWIANKRTRQVICKWRGGVIKVASIIEIVVIFLCRFIADMLYLLFKVICVHSQTTPQRCQVQTDTEGIAGEESTAVDVMAEFVLYLEDERDDQKTKAILKKWKPYPQKWISHGDSNQPSYLLGLLSKHSPSEAFREFSVFYSKQISDEERYRTAPNCWALPIVTLTSILYAATSASAYKESLLLVVNEGLRYIRFVDENMDQRGTERMQKAAHIVWEKLYFHSRWMNVKLSLENLSDCIRELHTEAKKEIKEDHGNREYFSKSNYIANCMYTTIEIILDGNNIEALGNLPGLAERLEKVLTGLLGACLTNLRSAIFKHCYSGSFGHREGKVRDAATILGETKPIVMLLANSDVEANFPEHKEYFDSWYEGSQSPQKLNLYTLLKRHPLSEAFREVAEFYYRDISAVELSRAPSNCWALPIVTLATILYATTSSTADKKPLMLAVRESLRYVRLVDENMDNRGTETMQKAAHIVWEKLYLKNKWLTVDLNDPPMIFIDCINKLRTVAQHVQDNNEDSGNTEYFQMSKIIANCMYTTTEIILERNRRAVSSYPLWSAKRLEKVLTGLLGACLSNLHPAILNHCSSGIDSHREGKVRDAATILGETKTIVMLLANPDQEANFPQRKEYFDSWCGRLSRRATG